MAKNSSEKPSPEKAVSRAAKTKGETAETMAGKQKEIAVSEFFAKNRHLLGFDNPRKALLTTVKEAVDNSLDACEEAQILPEVWIKIDALNGGSKGAQPALIDGPADGAGGSMANATRFRVTVRDNGPGIVKAQIPNVFGRLLYGSKFHRLRMSRGQQGIGISAAGMYGLLTTGQSVQIVSRTGKKKPTHRFELQMDTQKNRPEIISDQEMDHWSVDGHEMEHGTEVSITIEARFQRGRASVDEYLEQTAIANPHALIHWYAPDGVSRDFPREVQEVPESP
ncbi:MAG: DNA topoisomerase VI subunit B, partial [Tepidisphaeraceae bacterium]